MRSALLRVGFLVGFFELLEAVVGAATAFFFLAASLSEEDDGGPPFLWPEGPFFPALFAVLFAAPVFFGCFDDDYFVAVVVVVVDFDFDFGFGAEVVVVLVVAAAVF